MRSLTKRGLIPVKNAYIYPAVEREGVIDPIDYADPISSVRSPYIVSLESVVRHFSTSPERIRILDGFLRYREALHTAGVEQGFQWLDGSFLEDKETLKGEPPDDIDVVTLYHLPAGISQADLVASNPLVFGGDVGACKAQFHVDAYPIRLDAPPDRVVRNVSYWYGLFSHRRQTYEWKGILQVDLAFGEDAVARAALLTLSGGNTP